MGRRTRSRSSTLTTQGAVEGGVGGVLGYHDGRSDSVPSQFLHSTFPESRQMRP